MMRLLLIGLAFVLAGCESTSENVPPEQPNQSGMMSEADKRDCRADGGIVERAGLAGFERCTRPYSDAGEVCTDSSQCEGQCRSDDLDARPHSAVTGVCQANDNPFGCYAEVSNGRIRHALCVD